LSRKKLNEMKNKTNGLRSPAMSVKEMYTDFLQQQKISDQRKQQLLAWLVGVLQEEVGYIRPIKSVESAFRIWLGWVDRSFYSEYYLGLKYAEHQERWRENWGRPRFLQLAARGSGKSEIFSHEKPTRDICYIDGVRILLATKTVDLGEKYLYVVKDEFETNKEIIEDFGDLRKGVEERTILRGKSRKWTQRMFYVARYGDRTYKDPTMEATGIGRAITGSRFNKIIVEDPIEQEDCKTKRVRDKHENWLEGVVENLLEPNGQVFVIGTRKHGDDLYKRLIKNPAWVYRVDKAVLRYPKKYEYVYQEIRGKKIIVDVKMSDKGEALWDDPKNEHSWPMKKLLIKKGGTLPHIWAREQQNEILEEKDKLMPMEQIEKNFDEIKVGTPLIFLREHHTKQYLAKVVGCDFSAIFDKQARKDEGEASWTVFTVLGIHRVTYERQLLYAWREQFIKPDVQIRQLVWIDDHLEPDLFVVEANLFQKLYVYMLEQRGLKKKVVPHVTGGEKWSLTEGIPSLARDIMNAVYIIPRGDPECRLLMDQFIAELNAWSIDGMSSETTDCTMSMWLASLKCSWYERMDRRREEKARKQVKSRVRVLG